ncbi:hypothetical protein POPTR_003G014356v4 [Populus trichocarpa]|uniref:Uncharacterized protein n=1 Tax=Populus trichocarpa TaxID=3694 RepID=A0ACC0T7X5_POPTR|nr:hypothetical protein POPTR_003G014356v4 [Populus trichocarpa]
MVMPSSSTDFFSPPLFSPFSFCLPALPYSSSFCSLVLLTVSFFFFFSMPLLLSVCSLPPVFSSLRFTFSVFFLLCLLPSPVFPPSPLAFGFSSGFYSRRMRMFLVSRRASRW